MMSRQLPPCPPTTDSRFASPWEAPARAGVGFWRKGAAAAMHVACLVLFALLVVWPVASPIASGEFAREFKPVLEALSVQGWWELSPPTR